MSAREDARHLLDAVPDDQIPAVLELLRSFVGTADQEPPRRRFRTVGVFDGPPDLGATAKEIARRELGEGRKGA
ncbi:hypothetical protein [Allokutzneria sp. NRRL B-24872]|uniref:hypothetical protein n=1 Tax=Allokutzneria sp. NRRL B-24872 TaxID=1137961 RepID=UPI000A3BE857|nr:hypothetical protein [Allokutzneria sp. NRRL B-24872]